MTALFSQAEANPVMVALTRLAHGWSKKRLAEEAGLTTVGEDFADRAYTPEGRLVSRREPGAVLHEPDEIAQRCVRIATEGEVVAVDGSVVPAPAGSLCVHGDSPGAVEIARRVRAGLDAAGVGVTPFAGEPT